MSIRTFFLKIIPFLTKIKRFYYLIPSYSQEGEDILLGRLFDSKNIKKGFYVDIGCFHPVKYSNTYLLFLNGWHGINIDANPLSIEKFSKMRPKDININVGVSNEQAILNYHMFNIPAINTFSDSQAKKYLQKKTNVLKETKRIEVKPLHLILKDNLPNGCKITLMSIDVEGFDYNVLLSNDWVNYLPSVIVVENHTSNIEMLNNDKIYLFLKSKGYQLHSKLDLSCIYIHKDF